MRRLWNLDASTCDLLVAQLVTEGFLRQIEHEYVLGPAAWMSVVAAADAGTR
jgi:DNA-binding IclR family transcriptional regulator